MAHSASELDYYVTSDEHGKIIMHHTDIKQEPTISYGTVIETNIGSYSQNNYQNYNFQETTSTPQYTRVQNNYTVQQTENSPYTVVVGRHNTSIKNLNTHSAIKTEGKMAKYAVSNSQLKSEHKPQTSAHHALQTTTISRRRKPEKAGKGLRHFSMKVCEKVKEKGTTTYNEVADELVAEEVQNESYDSPNCDQKNIRRRVYDALNVLMAMNIISKDKKEIRWIGLPTNSVEQYTALEKENHLRRERIATKNQQLQELLLQFVSVKNLIERNKDSERQGIIPTPNSSVQLPFIIVNTHKSTKINCSVSNDKSEYVFKFDDKFEIHDDVQVLKRMGLHLGLDNGECTYEDIEKAKSLVPKNFAKYIEAYGRGNQSLIKSEPAEDWEMSYIHEMSDIPGLSKTLQQAAEQGELDEDDIISETSDID